MATARREQDDERLYRMLKALGNPVRLQIVRFVQQRPRCIGNDILLHLPEEMARAQETLRDYLAASPIDETPVFRLQTRNTAIMTRFYPHESSAGSKGR